MLGAGMAVRGAAAQTAEVIGSALRALRGLAVRDFAALDARVSRPRAPSRSRQLSGRQLERARLRVLPRHAVVGFEARPPLRVTCLGGELWVTGPGLDDQILVPGQSVAVTSKGRIVAEALRDARFVVTSAAGAR